MAATKPDHEKFHASVGYYHRSSKTLYAPKDRAHEDAFWKHSQSANAWKGAPGLGAVPQLYHQHKAKMAVGAPRTFSKKPREAKI